MITLSTFVPSLIRTGVPILVGSLMAWLVTLGIDLSEEAEQGLTVALTGFLIGLYYLIARLLEKRWPFLSFLLGSSQMPVAYANEGEKTIAEAVVASDGTAIITTLPGTSSTGSVEQGPGNQPTLPL